MISHIVTLALINIARAIAGFALGVLLLYSSDASGYDGERAKRIVEGDLTAFLVIGCVVIAVSCLRLVQGGASVLDVFRSRRARGGRPPRSQLSRRLGLGLSILDLVNIVLFPLSTACGVYGLIVCRHPDTIDFYEGRFSA